MGVRDIPLARRLGSNRSDYSEARGRREHLSHSFLECKVYTHRIENQQVTREGDEARRHRRGESKLRDKPAIMIFSGAGASFAVNEEKYPMTKQFYERLPKELKSNPHFKAIDATLKRELEQVDIEYVLWELKRARDGIAEIANPTSAIGRLIANKYGPFSNIHSILSHIRQAWRELDQLADRINENVYSLYGQAPNQEEVLENWLELLAAATQHCMRVDIFTVNYDRVLEYCLSELPKLGFVDGEAKLRIPSLGFTGPSDGRKLDLRKWTDAHKRKNGMLTKLHGSVNWTPHGLEIYGGAPRFSGNHANHVILYPGFKGEPRDEPFVTFHRYLKKTIERSQVLVFVGFSFRDDHINEILSSNVTIDKHVIVIDPSTKFEVQPEALRDVLYYRHIPSPFDGHAVQLATKQILEIGEILASNRSGRDKISDSARPDPDEEANRSAPSNQSTQVDKKGSKTAKTGDATKESSSKRKAARKKSPRKKD